MENVFREDEKTSISKKSKLVFCRVVSFFENLQIDFLSIHIIYQITAFLSVGFTIGSPSLQPNASANSLILERGPITLYWPGE